MVKTAVLVSGNGTNLQSIINALNFGKIKNCELTAVISSKPNVYALERAKSAGIQTFVIDYKHFPNRQGFNEAIYKKLISLDIELVVMAGFMVVLGSPVVEAFENRIINIHPSLVPAFCGDGFFGLRVHQEALNYGVKLTGATAHFATAVADAGPVILQRAIDIHEDDTAESLQKRVMEEVEWKILPDAMSLYCEGRLQVSGRIVHIKEASR